MKKYPAPLLTQVENANTGGWAIPQAHHVCIPQVGMRIHYEGSMVRSGSPAQILQHHIARVKLIITLKVIKRAYKEILKLPTELISDRLRFMDLVNWSIDSQIGVFSVFSSKAFISNRAFWHW